MTQKLGLTLESPVYSFSFPLLLLELPLLLPLLELPDLLPLLELLLEDLLPDLEDLEDLDDLLLLDLVLYLPDSKSINSAKKAGSNFFLRSFPSTCLVNPAGYTNSKSFFTHFLPLIMTSSNFPYLWSSLGTVLS